MRLLTRFMPGNLVSSVRPSIYSRSARPDPADFVDNSVLSDMHSHPPFASGQPCTALHPHRRVTRNTSTRTRHAAIARAFDVSPLQISTY